MLDLITGGALGLPNGGALGLLTAGLWGCPRHFPAIMAFPLVLVVASTAQGSALVWCPVALGVACLCEAPVAEAASDKAAVDAGASEGLGVADGQDLQRSSLGLRHSSGDGGTSTPNGPGGGRAPNAPASRSTGSRGTSLYRLYNNN